MDEVRLELNSLYRDRQKYRMLAHNCHDSEDKQYYIEMLDYLDKCIDIFESMVDCEV